MKEVDFSYHIRAQNCIAHGALTNSKRAECFVKGVYQTHLTHARGPFVWDVSGRRLFDFICGLGSCILGHANQQVAEAIYHQATRGITLSLSSASEIHLAEKVKEIIPWIDHVRFLKTGTEACLAAVKIARTKTGRERVLSEGYHGWGDEFISLTPPALGVNGHSQIFALSKNEITKDVAAVIIEPIMTDMTEGRIQWLRDLRQKCTETGTILIFDEIITGFRTPKFTMSNYFGIEPDLICLGKAMGNGMPIACVGGKAHVMNCGEYFVSSTFAGESCSIAAALSCIDQLQRSPKFKLDELWSYGENFMGQFNAIYPEKIRIIGYPSRGVFEGDPLTKALFWQEAYLADILFGSSFFFNFAHIPYTDQIINVSRDILTRIKAGSVQLKGEMPQSPFSQKLRESK